MLASPRAACLFAVLLLLAPAVPVAAQEEDPQEEVKAILVAPACSNCEAQMTETTDIFGRAWWVCWECAKEI